MARKPVDPRAIDQETILRLVDSAPDYDVTVRGVASPHGVAPPQATAPPSGAITAKASVADYVALFMEASPGDPHSVSVRISRSLREKLSLVVKRLGNDKLTLSTYINHILSHHLETYKEEINRLNQTFDKIL